MRSKLLLTCALCLTVGLAQAQNSCLSCHEKQDGPGGVPAREWKTSIHFQNSIACADCHGGNPRSDDPSVAMDPKAGFRGAPKPTEVPNFCGKCHSRVRDNYVTSAHYMALSAGAHAPNCVTCHTAHKQQKVTLDLINPQTCGQCHTFDRAARLKEAMRGSEIELTSLDKRVHSVFLEGLNVDREHDTLDDLRNRTHSLTHVLDISKILLQLNGERPDMQALQKRVAAKEKTIDGRKKLGTALMGFFLVGSAIAWLVHKNLMEEAHGSSAHGPMDT